MLNLKWKIIVKEEALGRYRWNKL